MRSLKVCPVACLPFWLPSNFTRMQEFPMTLVVLTPGFPKNEEDLSLSIQQQFVKTLHLHFPDLQVVVLALRCPASPAYQWHGAMVFPLSGLGKSAIGHVLSWIRAWGTLKKLRRNRKLIGLFSFRYNECALIGKLFSRRYSLKHFVWITGRDARKSNKLPKLLRPVAGELIAMSGFLANEFFINHSVRPAYIIPNGLEEKALTPNRAAREFDLVGIGPQAAGKNPDPFIAVTALVRKHNPSVKASIWVDGPEFRHLQISIRDTYLVNNISIKVFKTRAEILGLLAQTKIFLDTSPYEGSSSVCLEALQAGAHVISLSNPMTGWVNHWHIAESKDDMAVRAVALLQSPNTEFTGVQPLRMSESVRNIMKLFGCSRLFGIPC